MQLAVVADSHIPDRADGIPEPFRDRIAAADRAVHAGDYESADALAEFRDLAGDLTAVRGNVDPPGIELPSVAVLEVEGVTVVASHGAVNPGRRAAAVRDGAPGWPEGDEVVRDGDDWLDAVVSAARIGAADGATDALDRACFPGPAEFDDDDAAALGDGTELGPDPDRPVIGIGGHSHRVVDDARRGVVVLNPGTVTGADPGTRTTMMTVDVADGEYEVSVNEVEE